MEYLFVLTFSGRVYTGTISDVTVGKIQPKRNEYKHLTGLQIRVRIGKLFSLFDIQNICCQISK